MNNFLLLSSILLLFSCAPAFKGEWAGNLDFQKEGLGKDRLAVGRSILVLPIIVDGRFDTLSNVLETANLAVSNSSEYKLTTCRKTDLDSGYLTKYKTPVPELFYSSLLTGNLIPLYNMDSVWSLSPCRYLLTIKIIDGMTIRSFENTVKKKAVLEGELWDTRGPEIVWRASVMGYEENSGRKTADFISTGVTKLISFLPSFIPVENLERW